MTKTELIDTLLDELPPGNRRGGLQNAHEVKIVGIFKAACHREFTVVRAVDYPQGGKRRVTYYGIGEWAAMDGSGPIRRCGYMPEVPWTEFQQSNLDFSEFRTDVILRLVKHWRVKDAKPDRGPKGSKGD